TFQAPASYFLGGPPTSVAVADFNGDGRLDLAVPDLANGAADVLLQMLTGVDVTQTSLNFGRGGLCNTSTLSTTLINLDDTTLSIKAIQVTGGDKDEFSQVNTCGKGVPAQQSCTITVTFKPKETGTDSAIVSISYNGADSPQQVTLSGL